MKVAVSLSKEFAKNANVNTMLHLATAQPTYVDTFENVPIEIQTQIPPQLTLHQTLEGDMNPKRVE